MAAPQLKRLVAGFSPQGPGFSPGLVKWDLWWTKWRWGTFSLSTSVSPANLHSTKFSINTITRAGTMDHSVADMPSGPSMDSTLHYANCYKLINFVFQKFPLFISEIPAGSSSYIVQIIPIYFVLIL
jgi:hypothetical protein